MDAETTEYSYGEVGHDPPAHAVAGPWQGPAVASRAAASNVSLCGKKLSRVKRKQPGLYDLCRECEELMARNEPGLASPEMIKHLTAGAAAAKRAAVTPAAAEASLPESLMQSYERAVIPMGKAFVDRKHAQQRNEQGSWVKQIADNFTWAEFNLNPVALSARADGRYHVMDGQHRIAGARLAGHGEDTQIHAHVWHGLTFEQEAALFVLLNGKRHTVKPLDLFMAQVTAGDADAAAMDSLLHVYGWEIGSAGRQGHFAAVTTLRRLYGKPGGPGVCEKIIATITEAWGHDSAAAHSTIIKVLGIFWEKYPQAQVKRLAQVLQRNYRPVDIHKWVHESHWQHAACPRLQGAYDSGLKDPKRRLETT